MLCDCLEKGRLRLYLECKLRDVEAGAGDKPHLSRNFELLVSCFAEDEWLPLLYHLDTCISQVVFDAHVAKQGAITMKAIQLKAWLSLHVQSDAASPHVFSLCFWVCVGCLRRTHCVYERNLRIKGESDVELMAF